MPHHPSSSDSSNEEEAHQVLRGGRGTRASKSVEVEDEKTFFDRLYTFMNDRGSPIEKIPIFDHKELDLYQLYKGVISRGGLERVIEHKLWRQITNELSVDPERTDAGFRLRIHYLKYLYPYERKFFLGLEDDDFDYDSFERQISKSHTAQLRDRDRAVRYLPARKKKNLHTNGHANGVHRMHTNGIQSGVQHNTIHPERHLQKHVGTALDPPTVNFKVLDVLTLKRYKNYHQLKLPATNKRELIDAISQHFATQKVDEDIAINSFVAHVRCHKETQREREQRRRNASRKMIPTNEERGY